MYLERLLSCKILPPDLLRLVDEYLVPFHVATLGKFRFVFHPTHEYLHFHLLTGDVAWFACTLDEIGEDDIKTVRQICPSFQLSRERVGWEGIWSEMEEWERPKSMVGNLGYHPDATLLGMHADDIPKVYDVIRLLASPIRPIQILDRTDVWFNGAPDALISPHFIEPIPNPTMRDIHLRLFLKEIRWTQEKVKHSVTARMGREVLRLLHERGFLPSAPVLI